jgi:serine/threonine protein kinase
VRKEALYCALVERSRILGVDELAQWKERLAQERYTKSLGEHLVAARRISVAQAGKLRQQQFIGLERENERAIEGYRKSTFEGVGRSITKNPKARLETGVFTIKELFRSAESQKLARSAVSALPEYPAKVGAYDILGVLGKGGMGLVLEARHEKGGDAVALKLARVAGAGGMQPTATLTPPTPPDEVKARMRREILAMSMLAHENIVQVLDAGDTADGVPFLVMELVRGRELRDHLRERTTFPPREALTIFLQILAAASAAHRAGIVHRDLKPENVLVAEKEGRLVAKLMDFGLARIVEIDPAHEDKVFKTQATNVVSGSPQYLSPEQVLGDTVDARTDLYALGVLLFELLTGEPPWAVTSLSEMVRAHVSRAPRTLAAVRPGTVFSPALEKLVASLLGKSPSERPANAADVIATIERDVFPSFEPKPLLPESQPHPRRSRGITRMLDRLSSDDGEAPDLGGQSSEQDPPKT